MTISSNTSTSTLLEAQYKLISKAESTKTDIANKIDDMLVRYDGWFLVLLAAILVFSVAVASGLAVWCLVYKGGRFSGGWRWNIWYVSVWAECR